ncbi:asparagine synthase (glutamine-hydrolyzing) [Pseudomonas donghuensis]|uniref:asparagine synthase (glutamine-hydrolyzing) n=1 Tax=Pseudomonas donghuensis TaxID=1163398 RepID=UPI0020C4C828|nr:asparagine synthase (glutamine-hydrolyzing) [Pseudomonas donghuensis]MBF4210501.1 asparagine synthase (glutamine-hydrolyzing) [Pseudomonas donghuensis]MCP6700050.1 asparagine synthase (glutamine-hydrolyzing) [Pseudomonas donghuensis]UVL22960.1 asparagine synthase (glutamine-hydrolyzing) [Pseudomonas donghuensis]
MCGIFGYFHRGEQSLSRETLRAMGDAIQHRGPDDQGVFSAPGVALGNQRLSIIDLAGGHQPFISDDGQIVVVQNGEIFNHLELAQELAGTAHACRTHSDTEVLLRLYEREGISFISKLNGMFAIAIYDAREQAMYLVRDRIGVKPLYVHDDGAQLTFGSEIKSLLKGGMSRPAMDEEALHHYLTFNYVPAPFTMYQGVRHLMPGHLMKVTRTGAQVSRWWDLAAIQPVHGRSEEDWIEEFNAILDDAVRLRLRCDVPFGAFLSGGVDSSTIVGLMARHMKEPVKTFCIGFDDPRYDESAYAQEAAERFGAQHTMERVEPDMLDLWPMATYHCDQPHGDVSFLPTYRVSALAAKQVKVVLTGDGGDELFAGYDKHRDFFAAPEAASWSDEEFQRRYFDSISLFTHAGKQALYTPERAHRLAQVDSFDVAAPYFKAVAHQDRINQALYLDMQLLLSGNNLVKPDRMGMAVSLEARTPFLDYRMMEFAFRMPGSLKLKDGVTKYLYKKAVAPLIGDNLAYRKKQMFTVPVGEWFKTTKAQYCRDNMPTQIFEPSAMAQMNDAHIKGRENRTREIRALIALSHWQKDC